MKTVKRLTALFLAMICVLCLGPKLEVRAEERLTGKSAMEIVSMMGKGYNLGNTFDATGGKEGDPLSQETSWGNPLVTKEMIDGVRDAGFKTIRIPVTWFRYLSHDGNYTIEEDFLDRVEEVVNWALEDGLFVIINLHHESWINKATLDTDKEKTGVELRAVWSQLCDRFADYDEHLIFEAMNEPRAADTGYEWTGNQSCYDAINYLNDIFVTTVRSNGKGNNPERPIMIPGYAASSSHEVMNSIVIPEYDGKQAENIIISVHCYSPYEFCLTDKKNSFDPNNSSDTADIVRLMGSCKNLFIDKGIPVIIGECGCTNSNNNIEDRLNWFDFFGRKTREAGIPAIVWDNGAGGFSGGECHRYIKRQTGENVAPELITAFIYGKEAIKTEAENVFIDFEPFKKANGETDMCTPQSVGFTNLKLFKQAKVNHTENAVIGFSLMVTDEVKDNTALLDIGGYADKYIRVSGFVCAKDTDHIEIGTSIVNESMMYTSVDATTDWEEFAFALPVESTETLLYFKGDPGAVFYVDDISIEITGSDEEEAEEVIPDEGEEDAVAPIVDVSTKKPGKAVVIALFGVLVLAVGAIFGFEKSRKKK